MVEVFRYFTQGLKSHSHAQSIVIFRQVMTICNDAQECNHLAYGCYMAHN